MSFTLNKKEKRILLQVARGSIGAALGRQREVSPQATENLLTPCGAFVTLHLQGELRGCIGHMSGHKSLIDEVRDLARSAAFHDPRFPPLKAEEFDLIDIEVSVLTPMEEIDSPQEVIVGRHGVYLEHGGHSGVLLPQVPVEQRWNREQYLQHLCLKAGLSPDCFDTPGYRLMVFEALVFGENEVGREDDAEQP